MLPSLPASSFLSQRLGQTEGDKSGIKVMDDLYIQKQVSRIDRDGPAIVIIGCGISGVAAAQRLFKHGFKNVRILEASDRSGGRIWSTKFGNTLVDMGALWIHGPCDDNPVFRLASQYGLLHETALLEENKTIEAWRHPPGNTISYSSTGHVLGTQLIKSVEDYFTTLLEQAREFLHMKTAPVESVGEFIKKVIVSHSADWHDEETIKLKLNILHQYLKVEACINGVHSMDEIALKSYGEFNLLPGLDCAFPNGYSSLIDCMMSSLPKQSVMLNKPVRTVHWNGAFRSLRTSDRTYPNLVECEDGDTFTADHVIVTVPLGFLKVKFSTFFKPPPPLRKVHAIQKIGFGTHNKFFLAYETPFWKPDCQILEMIWEEQSPLNDDQADLQTTWVKKIVGFIPVHQPEQQVHILTGFISGPEAVYMETLTDNEVIGSVTQLLQKFTGNPNLARPVQILRSSWNSNPYVRGSFSHMPVGTSGQDIDALAEPLPEKGRFSKPLQVLFAGEATHRIFYTSTHGALLSGRREAERLLRLHGKARRHTRAKI